MFKKDIYCNNKQFKECLIGDTLIVTNQGLLKLQEIGDIDGEQWQIIDLNVITDKEDCKADKFYCNGSKSVYTVTTKSGYTITGTEDHKIYVLDKSNNWIWKSFKDIKNNDIVPVQIGMLCGSPSTSTLTIDDAENIGIQSAKTDQNIPIDIRSSNNLFMYAAYLYGLYFTIGYVTDDKKIKLNLSTISLSIDVHIMLLNIGIKSYRDDKEITISPNYVSAFTNLIGYGFDADKKNEDEDIYLSHELLLIGLDKYLDKGIVPRSVCTEVVFNTRNTDLAASLNYIYEPVSDIQLSNDIVRVYDISVANLHRYVANGFICS